MGRPSKLTPDSQAQIVKALRAGATRTDAAHSAGVDYTSFLNWMDAGQKAKSGKFFEFFHTVTVAESEVRISLANSIAIAGKTDWRAAEAYLKRRDPLHWGDRVQVNRLTDDELLRLLAIAESGGLVGGGPAAGAEAPNAVPSTDAPAD